MTMYWKFLRKAEKKKFQSRKFSLSTPEDFWQRSTFRLNKFSPCEKWGFRQVRQNSNGLRAEDCWESKAGFQLKKVPSEQLNSKSFAFSEVNITWKYQIKLKTR